MFVLMRKFIFSFLILVMLMPSLACAMPTCVGETEMMMEQPCAEHNVSQSEDSQTDSVNLLIDCMGVDLQKTDTTSLTTPDLKKIDVGYAINADLLNLQSALHETKDIRGPPSESKATGFDAPIFLTTQRFRI